VYGKSSAGALPGPIAGRGRLKLVVFDCDGTLVDSQHMICAAMKEAYGAHDLPCPPRERILSIVGLSLTEAFTRLGGGGVRAPLDQLVESYKSAFHGLRQSPDHLEPLFPGARAALDALSSRGHPARHRHRQVATRRAGGARPP
jgi:phosphoglycolate phosphatase